MESKWIVLNDRDYPSVCGVTELNEVDPKKLILFVDHIVPANSEETDVIQTAMRRHAKQHGTLYYEGKGIGYLIMAEQLLNKGDIVSGTGAHIGTIGAAGALGVRFTPEVLAAGLKDGCYTTVVPETILVRVTGEKPADRSVRDAFSFCASDLKKRDLSGTVLEVCGSTLQQFSAAERAELCAVLTSAGPWSVVINDDEPETDGYRDAVTVDLSCPDRHILPPAEAAILTEGVIKVKSAFVGGCAGGGIENIRLVANIMRGKRVKDFLRFVVCPNTKECYLQAISEGLIEDLLESGVMVTNPHCSTCFGQTQGKIAEGENMISTGLCNAAGTAGSKLGNIYLASPEEVARVALCGFIRKEDIYGAEI